MISELPSPEVVETPKSITDSCRQAVPEELIENITYANSHTFSSSERCSKLVSTTNSIKRQMRSLQMSHETYCNNLVNPDEFTGNMLHLEPADEVLRLRKEIGALKDKVFILEKEINFLTEKV
jgi:hypothetical protein